MAEKKETKPPVEKKAEDKYSYNDLKLEVQELQILTNEMRMENQAMHNRLYTLEQHVITAIQINRENEIAAVGTQPVKEQSKGN